jgi:hypothetical protein
LIGGNNERAADIQSAAFFAQFADQLKCGGLCAARLEES